MSEKLRCCCDVAKAISDSSGLEGSVLIGETLLRKGSEDHKTPPKHSARGSAPFRALVEEVLCSYRPDQVCFYFSCPAFVLTHLSSCHVDVTLAICGHCPVKNKGASSVGFFFLPPSCVFSEGSVHMWELNFRLLCTEDESSSLWRDAPGLVWEFENPFS